MKKISLLIGVFFIFLFLCGMVSAEFNPRDNITGKDTYWITDFVGINATNFYGDGGGLTGVSAGDTNTSEYWDNLDTFNETQMENSGGKLTILISWLMSWFYTESEVNDINTSMQNYVDYQNTSQTNYISDNNQSINNYIVYTNGTMKSYVDAVNLAYNNSNNNYMAVLNTSNNNYILYTNGTMKAYVDAVNTAINNSNNNYALVLNTSNNNYILFVNGTMKSYVDSQDILFNNSVNNYILDNNNSVTNAIIDAGYNETTNASITNSIAANNQSVSNYIVDANNTLAGWVDNLFPRFTELVDQLGNFSAWDKDYGDLINEPTHLTNFTNNLNIGNWTGDKGDYYTSSEVDDLNTSQTNFIIDNNNSVNNYISDVNLSMNNSVYLKSEVDAQNTSQNNYILDNNNSVTNFINDNNDSVTNAITDAIYDDDWINETIYNETEVDEINNSMKNYVDNTFTTEAYVNTQNTSQTNYINFNNQSITNTLNLYVLISELVDKVGNWSADSSNYYTSSQVDDINTSMENYVLYVNSTNPTDTDTNAETECSGAQALLGNGTCVDIIALDDDTTYSAGANLSLDGTSFSLDASSVKTWLDGFYVLISGVTDYVGNWSADKGDYYTSSEVDDINTSMKNYVDDTFTTEAYVNTQNTSQTNYINFQNTSVSNALANRYTIAQSDAQNTSQTNFINDNNDSVNSYILWVNSTNPTDTNTNAETECSTDEVLLGNGTCVSSSGFGGSYDDAWINATIYNETDVDDINTSVTNYINDNNNSVVNHINLNNASMGNYVLWVNSTNPTDTDTSAETECADAQSYLGNGTCVDVIALDDDTTYTAGTGLTLAGTEFSHTDTTSQGNESNSGLTFIQDVLIDSLGHIQGLTGALIPTATPSDGDTTHLSTADQIFDYIVSLAYATTTYVDTQNTSQTNYINDVNTSVTNTFGNYYTQSEVNDINTSMKNYGDSTFLNILTGGTMSDNIDLGGNLIRSLGNPLLGTDAANRDYVDNQNTSMKNYADDTFLVDIVTDTTPQLGGYLDTAGQNIGSTADEIENIYVATNSRIYFGDGQEFSQYYNGTFLITGG